MTVFADTFFYLALFNTRDAYHRRAVDFVGGYTGGVMTTQWVLTEVADAMAGIPERRAILGKFRLLGADAGTFVVDATPRGSTVAFRSTMPARTRIGRSRTAFPSR